MDLRKPTFGTFGAVKSLAEKLEVSTEISLEQWSGELAENGLLREVLFSYDSLNDADEKFILMGVIVRAANYQEVSNGMCNSWDEIEQRLIWDFNIHSQTIIHWAFPGSDIANLLHPITPLMKDLWQMSKIPKKKVLFVCTINLMRSPTAQRIYTHDLRFEVKSAGTYKTAKKGISRELLEWSDLVVVMGERHMHFIEKMYPDIIEKKKIICLDVPDNFDYMQPELISLLRERFECRLP